MARNGNILHRTQEVEEEEEERRRKKSAETYSLARFFLSSLAHVCRTDSISLAFLITSFIKFASI